MERICRNCFYRTSEGCVSRKQCINHENFKLFTEEELEMNEINKTFVRELTAVGEYLIKNAESIIGIEEGITDMNISINLDKHVDVKLYVEKNIGITMVSNSNE